MAVFDGFATVRLAEDEPLASWFTLTRVFAATVDCVSVLKAAPSLSLMAGFLFRWAIARVELRDFWWTLSTAYTDYVLTCLPLPWEDESLLITLEPTRLTFLTPISFTDSFLCDETFLTFSWLLLNSKACFCFASLVCDVSILSRKGDGLVCLR